MSVDGRALPAAAVVVTVITSLSVARAFASRS
ncbi:hypothetical protein N566_14125 [Streptomycetaceae bacterium MP113-05]|nr:hypothetical protein N566_14125 [Streptomycetaceae bacterium MP113-05]